MRIKVPIYGTAPAKATYVEQGATVGAQIGTNLLMPDGAVGTLAQLQALFGSGTPATGDSSLNTTDDLDEGQWHLWFTERRAQDAVGGILADTATIGLAYTGGASITATLKDLADSGTGAALAKITRDAKGRISGTSAATTTDLTEGDNLYFTDERAQDAAGAALDGTGDVPLTYNDAGNKISAALSAGVLAQITDNLLPAGYIDGLKMVWVSGTALTVTSGAAYIPGSGKVLRAASDIAKTGLSLSASTWYHVYLYDNAGTADIEIVTTAPAAAYNGTARSKTGDTSRRYVGSVKSSSGGAAYNFLHTAATGLIFYRNQQDATPFRLLQNGQATIETAVSAAAVAPVTAFMLQARLFTSVSTPSAAYFATSDDSAAGPPTSGIVGVAPNSSAYTLFPMNSSQQITYWNQSAPGINQGAFVDVYGYLFDR